MLILIFKNRCGFCAPWSHGQKINKYINKYVYLQYLCMYQLFWFYDLYWNCHFIFLLVAVYRSDFDLQRYKPAFREQHVCLLVVLTLRTTYLFICFVLFVILIFTVLSLVSSSFNFCCSAGRTGAVLRTPRALFLHLTPKAMLILLLFVYFPPQLFITLLNPLCVLLYMLLLPL